MDAGEGVKEDNSDHSPVLDAGVGGLNWAGVSSDDVEGMDIDVADMDDMGCRNGACVCADVPYILL